MDIDPDAVSGIMNRHVKQNTGALQSIHKRSPSVQFLCLPLITSFIGQNPELARPTTTVPAGFLKT